MSFESKTGLMGTTQPGQRVTADNVDELPPGSVIHNDDGSRIIHLHDNLWLWCCDGAHCYGRIRDLAWRLSDKSTLCHIP